MVVTMFMLGVFIVMSNILHVIRIMVCKIFYKLVFNNISEAPHLTNDKNTDVVIIS